MTDNELITRFLEGDNEAYHVIVTWIKDVTRTHLWKHNIFQEDIISDTTLKLLMNFRNNCFEYKSTLKTYVQRIARFTIIDSVRMQQYQLLSLEAAGVDPPGTNNPAEFAEEREQEMLFKRLLSLMDEKCVELWRMTLEERRHYKDIAMQFKVSEGTIKSRVFRCKEEAIKIWNSFS